ncbi:hypothetical protein ATM97_18870 [Nocardia sp. MH4]|uniref:hypothetical protein n=1 Tax=Nocardia sp. MH4 TaxID=1768677 RepID=UPI001C4EC43E|nr:hypothetical protein [Nocardia sp. MH4]MBW0272277.1 hypothetical protein [Nocardia sp. MH4]
MVFGAAVLLVLLGVIAFGFSPVVGVALLACAASLVVIVGVRNRPRRVTRRGQPARWVWGASAAGLASASRTLRTLRDEDGSHDDGGSSGGCGGGSD